MSKYFRKNRKRMLCFLCMISLCMHFPAMAMAEEGKVWTFPSLYGVSFREIAGNGWMACAYNDVENTKGTLSIPTSYRLTNNTTEEETIYTVRGFEDKVFGTRENGSNYTFSKILIEPSDDVTIGKAAFQGIQVESTFSITNRDDGKLKQIGESAFENAEINGDMLIGSLDNCNIGANAFRNVQINGILNFYGSADTIGDYAFSNLSSKGFYPPKNVRHIGNAAFYNMKMTGATFPLSSYDDSLETIGSRVFEGTELKAIKLSEGNHLTSVAEDAFAGIEGTTIIMPQTTDGNTIINIINQYHINISQNLIIQIPENLSDDSSITIYLQQNGFVYQKGEEGEIIKPTPTEAPGSTTEPGNTSQPEDTTKPDNTTPPEDTMEPDNTTPPEDTMEPDNTSQPEDTTKPDNTTPPEDTTKPGNTTPPDNTTPPEDTTKPDNTTPPEDTMEPDNTSQPEDTTKPDNTTPPEDTTKPDNTGQPENTTKPAETKGPATANLPTPAVSDIPPATKTPSHTTMPKIEGSNSRYFSVNNQKYQVLTGKTVAFIGCTRHNVTTVRIPSYVKRNGKRYQVVAIAKNACKGYPKLKKVTIGNRVKSVGSAAFRNCKKLRQIIYGKSVTSIGKNGLRGNVSLQTVTIKSKKLKAVGKAAFRNVPAALVVKVPKKQITAYKKLIQKAK